MVNLVNLTPHPVIVAGTTIPASGKVVRVNENTTAAGHVSGLPVTQVRYDDAELGVMVAGRFEPSGEQLPPPQPGTAYLVSLLTAQTLNRDDMYFPYDLVRDNEGNIVGARSLGQPA